MCNHSIPVSNNNHYIYAEDGSSWMMLWSKPDLLGVYDAVVMLDQDNRVVVISRDIFQRDFLPDPELDPTIELDLQ